MTILNARLLPLGFGVICYTALLTDTVSDWKEFCFVWLRTAKCKAWWNEAALATWQGVRERRLLSPEPRHPGVNVDKILTVFGRGSFHQPLG